MNRTATLSLGLVTAGALATAGVLYLRNQRRGELTKQIFDELSRLFNPSEAGLSFEKAFDIHYHTQFPSAEKITFDEAKRHANAIHDAWGYWWGGDDENALYATFRKFTDKVMVSQVADVYQREYKVNLIDKIKVRLDPQEITKVLGLVRNLPAYI